MKKLFSEILAPSEELSYPSILAQAYLEYNSYQIPIRGDSIRTENPSEITYDFISKTSSEKLG